MAVTSDAANQPFLPDFDVTGAERILTFRRKLGWSRTRLAVALGYSYSYIANIEKQLQPMSDRFLIRLAAIERRHDGKHFVDFYPTHQAATSSARECIECGSPFLANTPTRRLCLICSPPRLKA
ncbi:MAG TPA: helix-turn-helix transcriptional regulator [Anaerolineales bacterium]|nr:helix-turn-helix transcriptional regulator [Anaerolineales bacterium]